MDTSSNSFVPPYISFRTLANQLTRMEEKPPPPRLDRTYLVGMSGGYQGQVLAAFRALGLIDEEGAVQPVLRDLVRASDEERRQLLGAILREKYPEAVRLAEENATQGQLEEAFRKYGLSAATLRKAVVFYLNVAEYAGVPLSPHFSAPSAGGSADGATRRRPRRQAPKKPAAPPPEDTGDLRTRYVEMLLKRAEEDMDDKLLDRIERVIGIQAVEDEEAGKTEEPVVD